MSQSEAWIVTALGMTVVFIGLLLCVGFIQLFSRIAKRVTWGEGGHGEASAAAPSPAAPEPAAMPSEPVPADILAVIDELGEDADVAGVIVCACGFVADHLEVLYDLDIEAARRAETRGLAFDRTACVNDDPTIMAALAARVMAAAGG